MGTSVEPEDSTHGMSYLAIRSSLCYKGMGKGATATFNGNGESIEEVKTKQIESMIVKGTTSELHVTFPQLLVEGSIDANGTPKKERNGDIKIRAWPGDPACGCVFVDFLVPKSKNVLSGQPGWFVYDPDVVAIARSDGTPGGGGSTKATSTTSSSYAPTLLT